MKPDAQRPPGSRAADARRAARVAALALALLSAAGPAPAAAVTAKARPAPTRPRAATRAPAAAAKTLLQAAADARALEELGAYGRAADALRALRGRMAPDADLELSLALDEARSGGLDSAAARLWSPLLTTALGDTMPFTRRRYYDWQRENVWVNGRYDGWAWYIARARAEVAVSLGRWAEALDAARIAVADHPLSGKDRLVLAVCAGRAGEFEEAERAARKALYLDPTLPEAHYLVGLYDWRGGRRHEAQEAFQSAMALDSSYREPALALMRSRLPGIRPDTLPAAILTGPRVVELITSPARPKSEEFVQMDTQASILEQKLVPFPDSLSGRMKSVRLFLSVLIGEDGRAVANEVPWLPPSVMPEEAIHLTLASVPGWRFNPGTRHGQPARVWGNLQITYNPEGPRTGP